MIRDAEFTRIQGKVITQRLHDLGVPSSINPGFPFTSFDHLHGILYKSETAPRLPGTPFARDLPFPASQYIPPRSITALHAGPA